MRAALVSVCFCVGFCVGYQPPTKCSEVQHFVETDADRVLALIFSRDCSKLNLKQLKVTVSAYTASVDECDCTPEVTASMTPSRIGLLAVSRDLLKKLPFGTKVILGDYGVFTVADVMNKRYSRRVDILHANKKAAKLFGVKSSVTLYYY